MLLQGTELHPPASPPSEVPVFLRVIHTDDDEQHAMPPLAVQATDSPLHCTRVPLASAHMLSSHYAPTCILTHTLTHLHTHRSTYSQIYILTDLHTHRFT
eukprot:5613701-Pleurochrysis_carterae.AAC.2